MVLHFVQGWITEVSLSLFDEGIDRTGIIVCKFLVTGFFYFSNSNGVLSIDPLI